jgi:hypothetical protein
MQAGFKNLDPLEGQITTGGNGVGIYKHSAGENWASEVGRLGAWALN